MRPILRRRLVSAPLLPRQPFASLLNIPNNEVLLQPRAELCPVRSYSSWAASSPCIRNTRDLVGSVKTVECGACVFLPRLGLVVPVIRNADKMNCAEIEKEINALANKATEGRLSIDEFVYNIQWWSLWKPYKYSNHQPASGLILSLTLLQY